MHFVYENIIHGGWTGDKCSKSGIFVVLTQLLSIKHIALGDKFHEFELKIEKKELKHLLTDASVICRRYLLNSVNCVISILIYANPHKAILPTW